MPSVLYAPLTRQSSTGKLAKSQNTSQRHLQFSKKTLRDANNLQAIVLQVTVTLSRGGEEREIT